MGSYLSPVFCQGEQGQDFLLGRGSELGRGKGSYLSTLAGSNRTEQSGVQYSPRRSDITILDTACATHTHMQARTHTSKSFNLHINYKESDSTFHNSKYDYVYISSRVPWAQTFSIIWMNTVFRYNVAPPDEISNIIHYNGHIFTVFLFFLFLEDPKKF